MKMRANVVMVLSCGLLFASCAVTDDRADVTSEAEIEAAQEPVQEPAAILPEVPEGAQAVSLYGAPLVAITPGESTLAALAVARADYEAGPDDADNIIWYGRRTAYAGDYREAIRIFTEGARKFPEDARMLRHRGHRYISIRDFGRAIDDLERADALIEGTEDQVEPDGLPNAQNIPIGTLHTNIWYHLGLAYYLVNDLEGTVRVYRRANEAADNDDKLVSTTHWLYMALRRLNRDDEAEAALEPIRADMEVIENMSYHQLCLLYKGEMALEALGGDDLDLSDSANAAVAYGIGSWHFYNDRPDRAREVFERIVQGDGWASFGRIAAEADLVRSFDYSG